MNLIDVSGPSGSMVMTLLMIASVDALSWFWYRLVGFPARWFRRGVVATMLVEFPFVWLFSPKDGPWFSAALLYLLVRVLIDWYRKNRDKVLATLRGYKDLARQAALKVFAPSPIPSPAA